jgi:hypothetical protein
MPRKPTPRLKLRLWFIEMEGEGLAAVIGGLLLAALVVGLHYATR